MKTRYTFRAAAIALGALALLAGSLTASPVRAQDPSDKPVTLNLKNVPIQTALTTLFKVAGIKNFTISSQVQGNANIQVDQVPFSTALSSLLNAANPPAAFTTDNGSYTVTLKSAITPPAATVASTTVAGTETSSTADQPRRFYPIPINNYDAFVIASLIGAQGIVDVPANITRGGGSGQQGGQGGFGGGQGGFGGGQGGFGGLGGGVGVSTVGGGVGGFGGGGGGYGGRGGGGYGGRSILNPQ